MVLTHHKIYFNITWPNSFVDDFRSLLNWHSVRNNATVIPLITPLSFSSSMFQMQIYSFIRLICRFITMLRLPNPLVKPFNTQRAPTCFVALHTNQFWAPLFNRQPFYRLLLHRFIKLNKLRLVLMAKIRPTLCIGGQISSSRPSTLSCIPFQFSTNSRGVNSQILSNIFLFHSSVNEGFNLIPLYQTELAEQLHVIGAKD